MEAAEKAFVRARAVDRGRQRLSQLARMHAHMCQGLGQHRRAAGILTEALGSDLSPDATVECLHLRGEETQVPGTLCPTRRMDPCCCCCVCLATTCTAGCSDFSGICLQRHCKACNADRCTFRTGACHHALGSHLDASKDYTGAFSLNSSELGDDSRSRQFLTFYQREMALYARRHIDRPVEDYCLDYDLHPIFKASGYCHTIQRPFTHTALDILWYR